MEEGLLPPLLLGSSSLSRLRPLHFDGTYELTLDAKNRLSVPARFRGAYAQGLTALPGIDENVELWPSADFMSMAQRTLADLPPLSKRARRLKSYFGSAHTGQLDSAGRLLLAPGLIRHADLGKQVVVAGAMDKLLVWSPPRYEANAGDVLAAVREMTDDDDGDDLLA